MRLMGAGEITHIYCLSDPRDGTVRYVGKADNPSRRLLHHLKPHLLKARTQKNSWIRKLLSIGMKPLVRVLEKVEAVKWEEREKYWIAHLRKLGQPLTNGTEGGDGGAPLPEIRKRISEKLRGRKLPEEQRRKMGEARRGKKRTPEAIEKFRLARRGHAVSAETRLRISKANTGKRHTQAARLAISLAGRGRKQAFSRSQYLGVSPTRRNGYFEAYLTVNNSKSFFLGHYADEISAARARDLAAAGYFGQAAVLNFPGSEASDEAGRVPFAELVKNIRHKAKRGVAMRKAERGRTSRYRGVVWVSSRRSWEATISLHRKNIRLGSYRTEEEAAVAYDRASLIVNGSSALLNFPDQNEWRGKKDPTDAEILRQLAAIRYEAKQKNKVFFRKRAHAACAYLGVSFIKSRKAWQAYVKLSPNKRIYVGSFDTAERAALAYDQIAREHLGAKANLNFGV